MQYNKASTGDYLRSYKQRVSLNGKMQTLCQYNTKQLYTNLW